MNKRGRLMRIFLALAILIVVAFGITVGSFQSRSLANEEVAQFIQPSHIKRSVSNGETDGEIESLLWGLFSRSDYTFKTPEGAWPFLYLFEAHIETPAAWLTDLALWYNGRDIVRELEAIPVELKPSALQLDNAEVWDTYKDGELVGHYIVMRRGVTGIQFVVEGQVFEDADKLSALLDKQHSE